MNKTLWLMAGLLFNVSPLLAQTGSAEGMLGCREVSLQRFTLLTETTEGRKSAELSLMMSAKILVPKASSDEYLRRSATLSLDERKLYSESVTAWDRMVRQSVMEELFCESSVTNLSTPIYLNSSKAEEVFEAKLKYEIVKASQGAVDAVVAYELTYRYMIRAEYILNSKYSQDISDMKRNHSYLLKVLRINPIFDSLYNFN